MSNIQLESDITKNIILLDLHTICKLIETNPDALTLYVFYHKQSKIQKTNQSWSTAQFCMKGLTWGRNRFTKAKSILESFNLIEEIRERDESGKFNKKYVKLNYIHKSIRTYQNPHTGEPVNGSQQTNALSNININALSIKKEMHSDDFEVFWKLYPRKVKKGEALKSWLKKNPDIEECKKALVWQKTQDEWVKDNGAYIPHPTTWINQERWKDELPPIRTNFYY